MPTATRSASDANRGEKKSPAKALSARELKQKFTFGPQELAAWRKELRTASDRSSALLLTNLLDQSLRVGLLVRLHGFGMSEERLQSEFFDEYGLLYLLDQKIKMAHALGLIGNVTRKNLDIVRKIRNLYAHSPHGLSFSTPAIRDMCRELVRVPEPYRLNSGHCFRTPKDKFLYTTLEVGRMVAFFGGIRVEFHKPEDDLPLPPLP